MSYTIYKTLAIIIRIIPQGEANRDLVLLTRDLGKITVRVQSGRSMESKMRMYIVRYNQVMVDVVHGKTMWRMTGITQLQKNNLYQDEEMLHALHRSLRLAEHLIRGEEAHPELFDFFSNLLLQPPLLLKEGAGGGGGGVGLELFAVIKVLDHLGYWSGEKFPELPTDEILQKCKENKKTLVAEINTCLEATQLVV